MELVTVKIKKPAEINFILGQSHFIKTVEDIYEALCRQSQVSSSGWASANPLELAWFAGPEPTTAWSN